MEQKDVKTANSSGVAGQPVHNTQQQPDTPRVLQNTLTNNHQPPVSPSNSTLEQYGVDLTKKARENGFHPVVDRENEIEQIIGILLRKAKKGVLLIGEAGVGKTAIVEELALRIIRNAVPTYLQGKRIIALDLPLFFSSRPKQHTLDGEFEDKIILFIDDIHNFPYGIDLVKSLLTRGKLPLIATTSIDEYRQTIEKDSVLNSHFQKIHVGQPSIQRAIAMLEGIRPLFENFHYVRITDEAVEAAVRLSRYTSSNRCLPARAIDLIDEAAANARLAANTPNPVVTKDAIEQLVSASSGIPLTRLSETEPERLSNLDRFIYQRITGQEQAVEAAAGAIRRGMVLAKNENRPIASLLFLGPAGVGKTELAKTLSEALFGSQTFLLKIPSQSLDEWEKELLTAIRTKPAAVVLLDNIEKLHPDSLYPLRLMLENGALLKKAIIITTATTDAAWENSPILASEFRNLFDEIIIFNPLTTKHIADITTAAVKSLVQLLSKQGVGLEITENALTMLSQAGADPTSGAHHVHHTIQTHIENPLSMFLASRMLKSGDTVVVDYVGEQQKFTYVKKPTVLTDYSGLANAPDGNAPNPQPNT